MTGSSSVPEEKEKKAQKPESKAEAAARIKSKKEADAKELNQMLAALRNSKSRVDEEKKARDDAIDAGTRLEDLPPLRTPPSVKHPLDVYGYDAKEGWGKLKQWMGPVEQKIAEVEKKHRATIETAEQKRDSTITEAKQEEAKALAGLEEKKQAYEVHRQREREVETKQVEAASEKKREIERNVARWQEEQTETQRVMLAVKETITQAETAFKEYFKKTMELSSEIAELHKQVSEEKAAAVQAAAEGGGAQDKKEEQQGQPEAKQQEKTAAQLSLEQKTALLHEATRQKDQTLTIKKRATARVAELEQSAATVQAQIQQATGELVTVAEEMKAADKGEVKQRAEQTKFENEEKRIKEKQTQVADAATKAAATQTDSAKQAIAKTSNFVQDMKDTVNGWMIEDGGVKPEELEAKVQQLEKDLGPDAAAIKDHLDKFPEVVGEDINLLQVRAKERVHTNESFRVHAEILTAEVRGTKLRSKEMKKLEGGCMFVSSGTEPKSAVSTLTEPHEFFLRDDCKRAYVLVQPAGATEPQSLYYINQVTGECTKVCEVGSPEMKALVQRFADDQKTYDEMAKAGPGHFRSVTSTLLTYPGKSPQDNPEPKLSTYQEEQLKQITKHERQLTDMKGLDWESSELKGTYKNKQTAFTVAGSDWKETLPIAITDITSDAEIKAEIKQRQEESDTSTPEIARDKAIIRLLENKQDDCKYAYLNEKFSVNRRKNDEGQMTFFVTHLQDTWTEYNPWYKEKAAEAMGAMVLLCYKQNPMNIVELSCQPYTDAAPEHGERMQLQLRHAIEAAEKQAENGIFIGIRFGKDASELLDKMNDPDLKIRAKALERKWRENLDKKPVDDKGYEASRLGTLLVSPKDSKQGNLDEQSLLERAFVSPASEAKERIAELETEVKKLERKRTQLDHIMKSITEQVDEAANAIAKINSNPDEDNSAALAQQKAKVEELKASYETAHREYAKLTPLENKADADFKPVAGAKGIIQNFRKWMVSAGMKQALGGQPVEKDLVERVNAVEKAAQEQCDDRAHMLATVDRLQTEITKLEKREEQRAAATPGGIAARRI